MTRDELLRSKRFPKWLVGLMLVGAVFSGVACEANVDADGETVEEGEESEEDEADVDSDVDVDTDVQEDSEDDE